MTSSFGVSTRNIKVLAHLLGNVEGKTLTCLSPGVGGRCVQSGESWVLITSHGQDFTTVTSKKYSWFSCNLPTSFWSSMVFSSCFCLLTALPQQGPKNTCTDVSSGYLLKVCFLGSTSDLLIQTLSRAWEAECQQTIQVNLTDVYNSVIASSYY